MMGGLSNQMFQIAFIESLGLKYGMDVVYTDVYSNCNYNVTTHHRPANSYWDIFENVDWRKNQDRIGELDRSIKIPSYYVDVVPKDGIEYIGYFQCDKYFNADVARHLFKPSQSLLLQLPDYDFSDHTCSIHVRRGDYLRLSESHPVLTMDYYDEAMRLVGGSIEQYYIFSDDLQWCKDNFKGKNCVFVDEKDYISLFLMSRCAHHIIANSSFSWWGAWLGHKDGMVIAPKRYVGDRLADDHKDIIPKNWITI